MKVIQTTTKNVEHGEDSWLELSVTTDEGKSSSVSFGEGEPEDMYLFRDLSDAYNIEYLVRMAYEAGKRGEDYIYEELEEEDD